MRVSDLKLYAIAICILLLLTLAWDLYDTKREYVYIIWPTTNEEIKNLPRY